MTKTLFVNACVRGEQSRTLRLCREYLANKDDVVEIDLAALKLQPFDGALVEKRTALQEAEQWSDPLFDLSHQFVQAEEIVIGAPYWDLSFPSVLKVYFEYVSVCDIVFHLTEKGEYEGLCKAENITLIVSSGGFISEDENLGYDYIAGIAKMFGAGEVRQVVAGGLDIKGIDIEAQIDKARAELKALT